MRLTAYNKNNGYYIDSITSNNQKVLLNFKIDFSDCAIEKDMEIDNNE